jgi:[acyl-carrier-protein] S-malonyltransferase
MIAWMYPGQGSQAPGMAAGIDHCKPLFSAARSVVRGDLEKLCITDQAPTWNPDLIQPALFGTSIGLGLALVEEGLEPQALIGHSLGEFPALVMAGSLAYEDALRIVWRRGRAMAAAARRNPGGMAAVMRMDPVRVEEICDDGGDVWVANLNSPNQTVISGRDRALARAAERCLKAGAFRVVRLSVPIPGHCPLMEPAADQVAAELAKFELKAPACSIYFNADGRAHSDPREFAGLLVQAITQRVRFAEAVAAMERDGVDTFVEVGPGKVLRGLVRQIAPEASLVGVANDVEVKAFANASRQAATRVAS